jgi:putative aldouronate transport system substrate-binding protein
MKKNGKTSAFLMALVMSLTLLSGCQTAAKETAQSSSDNGTPARTDASETGAAAEGIDISEPVTLKMYLLGDKSKDFDAVYAEINKILKEKVNATVEVSFLSWAEHDQKYSLLFSGGEDFDLIFTAATWAHYETTAAMGGFYPLTVDFLRTYAPELYAVVPQVGWDQAEIEGTVYMVPQYQNEFSSDVYALRGDLMKKYGYDDITSLSQLMEFFDKIAADQSSTGISPRGNNQGGLLYEYFLTEGYTTVPGTPEELFLYHTQDASDTEVTYLLDWEIFAEYCETMKKVFEKGYWSKDSLASADQRQDGLLRGTSASMAWNIGSTKRYVDEANAAHPEWAVTLADIAPEMPKTVASYINNGMAINAASKNKERAMMVLNEFYTNKEIYDLAAYGIEGVHWKAVGDNQYETTDATADYGVDANCNWGWTNQNLKRTQYVASPTEADLKYDELLAKWNENVKPAHPLDGLSFDKTAVTSELAMVDSIIAEYYTPLVSGMAGDVPTAIAALRQQLENAGIQKIYDEFKRQAEEHVNRQ